MAKLLKFYIKYTAFFRKKRKKLEISKGIKQSEQNLLPKFY